MQDELKLFVLDTIKRLIQNQFNEPPQRTVSYTITTDIPIAKYYIDNELVGMLPINDLVKISLTTLQYFANDMVDYFYNNRKD